MNKNTEKWRKTGLLEQLDNENQCDELAYALEGMILRLFEEVPPYTDESKQFSGMILPIVRRLYDAIKPFPNIHWIYDDFKRFYTEQKELKQELWETAINKIDCESEFIALYVDDVVNRLNP